MNQPNFIKSEETLPLQLLNPAQILTYGLYHDVLCWSFILSLGFKHTTMDILYHCTALYSAVWWTWNSMYKWHEIVLVLTKPQHNMCTPMKC